MKIRFHVNAGKARALEARDGLVRLAAERGLGVIADGAPDVLVVLGGDGTILRAVREFPGVPVLGFNLGGLGYLSSVGEDDFPRALTMLAEGRYRVSSRTMLAVSKSGEAPRYALNDVVVMREMTGHAAVLDLLFDDRAAVRYMADGLVFATPTGSTAYSLSAGGPVLMPDSNSFVITPMNPHALGVRPIVVRDTTRLAAVSRRLVNGRAERLGVYADGETAFALGGDERIEVAKADRTASLVELEGYDACDVLSRKLGWSSAR